VKTALVTGATGFIGQHLLSALTAAGWQVRVTARDAAGLGTFLSSATTLQVLSEDLDLASPEADWSRVMQHTDVVFHLAGIAHRRADARVLKEINEQSPVRLLRAADAAMVGGFVWLSSIKVLGETSQAPLPENAAYAPADAYAASKAGAEKRLLELADAVSTRCAIIRPPLVYGPGVKANFLALLFLARLAERGLPLPFGQALAPRSLLGVGNLCDFLLRTAQTGSGVLHVKDAEDLCVADLLRLLTGGQRIRLLNVSAERMHTLLRLLRREGVYDRLYHPLQMDTAASYARLDWRPPMTSAELLQETMTWYRRR